MKKKLTMIIAAALCAVIATTAVPTDVHAMYPCSQDIINDANAKIAAAQAEYEQALATQAAALANFNAVKASNPSELELTVAGDALTRAQNASKWYLDQVNNAKAYLENITGRAAQETALQESREVLVNLTNLQAAKADYESAQGVAYGALEQIKSTQNAIAGYQQMVVSYPSLQPQLDALTAQLAALQADYAAKQAVADAKKAVFEAKFGVPNYNYSPYMEDYWNKRDMARGHAADCLCDTCKMLKNYKEKEEPKKKKKSSCQ